MNANPKCTKCQSSMTLEMKEVEMDNTKGRPVLVRDVPTYVCKGACDDSFIPRTILQKVAAIVDDPKYEFAKTFCLPPVEPTLYMVKRGTDTQLVAGYDPTMVKLAAFGELVVDDVTISEVSEIKGVSETFAIKLEAK